MNEKALKARKKFQVQSRADIGDTITNPQEAPLLEEFDLPITSMSLCR
jgi:hypothetical protein